MLNQIALHGRITRDPELRRTQGGVAVASFSIAVDQDFTDKEGRRATDFIDCTAWRQTAEFICKYFTKGQEIIVTGRLQNESWTDKDGKQRKTNKVVVERADFCGKKDGGTDSSAPLRSAQNDSAPRYADYAPIEDDDGDIPF